MNEAASRIAIIDFEASALLGKGRRSFPIEVGVGLPETGAVRSWLIKPERVWLDEWDWYYESEQVHRLTREYLLQHGLPRENRLGASYRASLGAGRLSQIILLLRGIGSAFSMAKSSLATWDL